MKVEVRIYLLIRRRTDSRSISKNNFITHEGFSKQFNKIENFIKNMIYINYFKICETKQPWNSEKIDSIKFIKST